MSEAPFIGRKRELRDLTLLLKKKTSSLVVIQGRRRIGKSRLVQEFSKHYKLHQFSGIPPNSNTTVQSQLDEFGRQLSVNTGLPELKVDDWGKLFLLLSKETKQGRHIIFFDEISWMGSKDPDFLGKLKNAWDLYFKKNPQLMLILCGSVSTWIEENILSHTGFLGRISLTLTLLELPLNDCNRLLEEMGVKTSVYEKFKLLSVTGGVPRYLEEIQASLSAEENIKRLCFTTEGILFKEFNDIFSDLFSKRSNTYRKIVEVLVNGAAEYNIICKRLKMPKSGHLSEYLNDLIRSGFISRDYTWHLNTGVESRLSYYRLSDNYLRFYLKYIEKNKGKIVRKQFDERSMISFPGWSAMLGLQFENLVLNNRRKVWEKLSIHAEEVISDNPFFQRKTTKTLGCQIDYLIHTRFNVLYICEIKFSKRPLGSEIIEEIQNKINALNRPKGFSCKPVLIHVNGVRDEIIENDFFAKIIDFGELLSSDF